MNNWFVKIVDSSCVCQDIRQRQSVDVDFILLLSELSIGPHEGDLRMFSFYSDCNFKKEMYPGGDNIESVLLEFELAHYSMVDNDILHSLDSIISNISVDRIVSTVSKLNTWSKYVMNFSPHARQISKKFTPQNFLRGCARHRRNRNAAKAFGFSQPRRISQIVSVKTNSLIFPNRDIPSQCAKIFGTSSLTS
jgi:hypothetical protein